MVQTLVDLLVELRTTLFQCISVCKEFSKSDDDFYFGKLCGYMFVVDEIGAILAYVEKDGRHVVH